jgi:hypothetical protein
MTHKSQAAKWRGPLFVDISARESAKRPRPPRANSTETAHDRVDYLSRSSTRFNTQCVVSDAPVRLLHLPRVSVCVWEFAPAFIFKERAAPTRQTKRRFYVCTAEIDFCLEARVSEAPPLALIRLK